MKPKWQDAMFRNMTEALNSLMYQPMYSHGKTLLNYLNINLYCFLMR
ncbi:MAG: hypothetical protein ACI84R_000197 [Candidatus Azotimanducaceae bacterium]|jgi:hypothetical protein